MKIGIFNPYLDGLTGGEKYMLTMASCLSKKHEVFVFWNDKEILKKGSDRFNIDLSNVHISKNIFSSSISFMSRFIKSKKYDLIIFLSDGSIPSVFCKLFIHFQFPVEWVDPGFKGKIKLSRVSKIFCNSAFTKQYIDKKFNITSEILYPPVKIQKQHIQKENIILNVGRFGRTIEGNNYKKQDIMIEAFKKMIQEGFKNWKLVFVVSLRDEDTERFKSLQDMAKGIDIEFIVNPSNSKLWEIYSKAKIYWHASGYGEDLGKHPEYAEHFGITTVEAMGAGAIPVVINAGGQKEIVKDGENGFLWNTIEELINKTFRLIEDVDLQKKLFQKAVIRAKYFNQERFCREVFKLIDE